MFSGRAGQAWRIASLKVIDLFGRLRMRGDPFGHLVFHHAILQTTYQLGIALVKFNHLRGLFVGRGDRSQHFGDATRVRTDVVLARQFADEHAGADAAASHLRECRNIGRECLALLLRLGLRLSVQRARLGFDHALRQFDFWIGGNEFFHDLVLQAHGQHAAQFAFQVCAHVGAEFRDVAAGNAEAGNEGTVDLGQFRFLHAHQLDCNVRSLASQRRGAEIRREIHVGIELVARGMADQRGFQILAHRAGADDRADALALVREAFALRGKLEQRHVAALRGALDRRPCAALLAQGFDHGVDVGFVHVRHGPGHGQRGDVELADFRQHLERGGVFDLSIHRLAAGGNRRRRRRPQFMFAHRLLETGTHQFRHGLAADLRAEALLDHLRRHLAGAESLQADIAARVGDARTHRGFVGVRREAHDQLAFELADVFYRNLHVLTSKSSFVYWRFDARRIPQLQSANPSPLVRKERLELSRVAPLEPKSSASTNSATFAWAGSKRRIVAHRVRGKKWWAV